MIITERIRDILAGLLTTPVPPPWYKVAKSAEQLIEAAEAVLEKIEQARVDAQAQGCAGPVYLVFGENHSSYDHMAIKILVLEGLKRQGLKTLLGIEMPHNYLDMHNDVPTQPVARRADGLVHDDDYTKAALARIYVKQDLDGPESRAEGIEHPSIMMLKYVWRQMMSNDFSARFIDASSLTDEEVKKAGFKQRLEGVSLNDPLTQRIALSRGIQGMFNILSRTVPQTLALRDAFMVEAVNQHVQDITGAHVYVLSCGSAHVFGHYPLDDKNYEHKDSVLTYTGGLASALQKQGAIVVPVVMDVASRVPAKNIERSGIDKAGIPEAQRLMIATRGFSMESIIADHALALARINLDAPYGGGSLHRAMTIAYETYVLFQPQPVKPLNFGERR